MSVHHLDSLSAAHSRQCEAHCPSPYLYNTHTSRHSGTQVDPWQTQSTAGDCCWSSMLTDDNQHTGTRKETVASTVLPTAFPYHPHYPQFGSIILWQKLNWTTFCSWLNKKYKTGKITHFVPIWINTDQNKIMSSVKLNIALITYNIKLPFVYNSQGKTTISQQWKQAIWTFHKNLINTKCNLI